MNMQDADAQRAIRQALRSIAADGYRMQITDEPDDWLRFDAYCAQCEALLVTRRLRVSDYYSAEASAAAISDRRKADAHRCEQA